MNGSFPARKLEIYNFNRMDAIPQLAKLPAAQRDAMKAVAAVLPFKVNQYVLEELIDWDRVPDDPMFRLTFPQRGMLADDDFAAMLKLLPVFLFIVPGMICFALAHTGASSELRDALIGPDGQVVREQAQKAFKRKEKR